MLKRKRCTKYLFLFFVQKTEGLWYNRIYFPAFPKQARLRLAAGIKKEKREMLFTKENGRRYIYVNDKDHRR